MRAVVEHGDPAPTAGSKPSTSTLVCQALTSAQGGANRLRHSSCIRTVAASTRSPAADPRLWIDSIDEQDSQLLV